MALSTDDRQALLAEPHVATLAVEVGAGRAPLTVPIWYQYVPGGQPWILTGAESRKARLIRAAGRFTLMVERARPSVRYVSVSGEVASVEPGGDAEHVELTERYLPPEQAAAYLEFARAQLVDQVVIRMRPQQWVGADIGTW